MGKNALEISKRLKFSENDRTDKNIIAQPEMNLQSFKGTPDSLKYRFKGSERKLSLGAPENNFLSGPIISNYSLTSICGTIRSSIHEARLALSFSPSSIQNARFQS